MPTVIAAIRREHVDEFIGHDFATRATDADERNDARVPPLTARRPAVGERRRAAVYRTVIVANMKGECGWQK
jgi:hypothetical protein